MPAAAVEKKLGSRLFITNYPFTQKEGEEEQEVLQVLPHVQLGFSSLYSRS